MLELSENKRRTIKFLLFSQKRKANFSCLPFLPITINAGKVFVWEKRLENRVGVFRMRHHGFYFHRHSYHVYRGFPYHHHRHHHFFYYRCEIFYNFPIKRKLGEKSLSFFAKNNIFSNILFKIP